MDPRLKAALALIIGFLAFNLGLQVVDKLVSSHSPSCTAYYEGGEGRYALSRLVLRGPASFNGPFHIAMEFDDPGGIVLNSSCGFLEAERIRVKGSLLSGQEYREILVVNVSRILATDPRGMLNSTVEFDGCIQASKPYRPRVLLYPEKGLVRGIDRVYVKVSGQGS